MAWTDPTTGEVESEQVGTADSWNTFVIANTLYLKERFNQAVGTLIGGGADSFAFAWQNPESTKIIVTEVIIDITTAGGTADSVLDIAVVADSTSTGDIIIDGLNLNAIGIADNIADKGSNGTGRVQKVDEKDGTNDYITGKILVADASSLVGKYYISYTKI